jgi:hypothetical protein
MTNVTKEILKIADIHEARIKLALKHVGHLFPLTPNYLKAMDENDMVWIELLINRFGKLQDIIGIKIIDLFLQTHQETTGHLTMLDKLHRLEKFEVISDVEVWKNMREVCNHIAHEYPDKPDVMAMYINKIHDLVPDLLTIFHTLRARLFIK